MPAMRCPACFRVGAFALGVLNIAVYATAATPTTLPQSTAIPIVFVHSVDASKAQPGEIVTAKTLQVVTLDGGESLPKGTVLVGHVVQAQAFQADLTPYAHQKSSQISIHFDKVESGSLTIPVSLSVRALANAIDSHEAAMPHSADDTDHVGTMKLIGGYEFSPLEKAIQNEDGDVVGYNRKNGVFARLISSEYSNSGSTIRCEGTDTEQSVAIFSPGACGVYGFASVYMPEGGQDGSGTFTLASRGHSMKLYAGSTALLQVNQAR